jgi:hypothetical protein
LAAVTVAVIPTKCSELVDSMNETRIAAMAPIPDDGKPTSMHERKLPQVDH